ncbi:13274_t:CDS:2 [Funneliformis caledonium]|uniref:13274_t:CDS:1 n=1 Tax=Funneliformis caledonium TaxID=1117310 RepID=A0A9N8V235_9GLOM|nr:13274_t:CDS:2 [Funneliformis caledonium]
MTTSERIQQELQDSKGEYKEAKENLKGEQQRLDEVKNNLRKLKSQIRSEKDEEKKKKLEGDIEDMEEVRDELEKKNEELRKDLNDIREKVMKFRDALLVDFGEGKGKKRSASDEDLTEERSHFFKKIQHFYPPPPELADTRRFKDYQDEKDPFILNYRPSYAAGLPVTLCSDILAKFQDDAKGNIELNKDDIIFVRDLSNKMCSFFSDENTRRNCFLELMGSYLNRVFDIYNFGNNRTTNGSIMFTKGNFQVPLLSLEVKLEIGMGSGCAYVQSTAYYVEFIKKFRNSPAISQSRFPVFLVYLAGPYMGVAGAVFLENPVCEPLTPVMPLFYLPHHEDILLGTAYVVKALKIALTNLEKFYDQLSQHSQIITEDRKSLCFQAIMEYNGGLSSQHVIIKFAKRYSEACHKECQTLGIAPKLFFCEQIAGGWYVVIMEQLMEHDYYFILIRTKIALYMRLSNILISPDDSIKIIDFDWSGKVGEVVYPPLLNQEIDVWYPDVKAGEKILPEHDLYILNTEFKKCEL